MFIQLLIGAFVIALTVLFQALAFDVIIKQARWAEKSIYLYSKKSRKAILLTLVVLAVSIVIFAEIWIWAALYQILNMFPDWETAVYFSTSSFTTVGLGDVVSSQEWRLLSVIEAVNGFLLFGWSTAFIFEIVSSVYQKEGKKLQK